MKKRKHLPERYDPVTGGGFSDTTDWKSARRGNVRLQGNPEEADTRLIPHSRDQSTEDTKECWSSADTHLPCYFWSASFQQKLDRQRNGHVTQYMQYMRHIT